MRYVDALYASAKFDEAAAALHEAVARDPTFKSIPEYKVGTSKAPAIWLARVQRASSICRWAGSSLAVVASSTICFYMPRRCVCR